MKIDPKQIARMITEDPDEIAPSDHFDDFEDEYEDPMGAEYRSAFNDMDVWGDFMVSYLNTNKHVPADFAHWADFPGSRQVGTEVHWASAHGCSSAPGGGHFHYSHPVYDEFGGAVWFDNGVWNYEWQTHA